MVFSWACLVWYLIYLILARFPFVLLVWVGQTIGVTLTTTSGMLWRWEREQPRSQQCLWWQYITDTRVYIGNTQHSALTSQLWGAVITAWCSQLPISPHPEPESETVVVSEPVPVLAVIYQYCPGPGRLSIKLHKHHPHLTSACYLHANYQACLHTWCPVHSTVWYLSRG